MQRQQRNVGGSQKRREAGAQCRVVVVPERSAFGGWCPSFNALTLLIGSYDP